MAIPVWREIARQEAPEARRRATCKLFKTTGGRPSRLPLARAMAIPERTRSRINSRSNSAIVCEDPEDQSAVRGGSIHALVEADEINS